MAKSPRRFFLIKPSLLTIPLNFPKRPDEPELSPLKEQIVQFGILEPLVVRPTADGLYLVLGGRRRLKAAWELADDDVHEKLVRTLPCYVVESDGPVTDLKIFYILNSPAPFDSGEMERIATLIEEASAPPPQRRRA